MFEKKKTLDIYREVLAREKYCLLRHENVKKVELHDHAFLEMTYILRGTAEHTLDGQVTTVRAGDYLIVDYGSRHSYVAEFGESFDNLDCLFLPELLDSVLKGTKSLRALLEHYLLHFDPMALVQNPARMVFHDEGGRIHRLLSMMQEEDKRRASGYTEMIRCYLVEILLLTVRQLVDVTAASGKGIGSALCAFVAEHYMEQISLAEQARQMHYSLPYVSQAFKNEIGISFVSYLQNYRVMQGCRLLSSTSLSLSEVAERVGYRDVKFFAALVKRHTGLSPAKFRRQQKG